MNKAFVREPDNDPTCPAPRGCGADGVPVSRRTVQANLATDSSRRLSETAFFCPTPGCKIAYFDALGAVVEASDLRTAVWPKDSRAPICPCFSVLERDLRKDAEAGSRDLVRSLVQRAESDQARCAECSPTGQSCVADVRRVFLKYYRPG